MYTRLRPIGPDVKRVPIRVALNDASIVCSYENCPTAWVFSLLDGHEVAQLAGGHKEGGIMAVAVNSQFVLTGGVDKQAILWSSAGGSYTIHAVLKELGEVSTVSLTASLAVVCTDLGSVKVWLLSDGSTSVLSDKTMKSEITCSDMDKCRIAVGTEDHLLHVWSNADAAKTKGDEGVGTWVKELIIDPNDGIIRSVRLSDNVLVAGTKYYRAFVFSLADGACLAAFGRSEKGSATGMCCIAVHQDHVVARSTKNRVTLWNIADLMKTTKPAPPAAPGRKVVKVAVPKRDPKVVKRLEADSVVEIHERDWSILRASYRHYLVTGTACTGAMLWCTEPGLRSATSQALGVSLRFMLQELTPFVESVADPDNLDPSYRDLSQILWTGQNPRHFRGSDKELCPRDGRPGCSIVDMLSATKEAGKATHFLSWSWGYKVSTMVSALRRWQETSGIDVESTFIWICFFVNNQYRILVEKEPMDSSDLGEIFASRLKSCGQVLVLLDTYQNPTYIQRVWCVFETFQATKNGVPLEVILPQTALVALSEDLCCGRLTSIRDGLVNIQVENASAHSKEDEENIKKEIRQTTGYEKVNEAVQNFLTDWITTAFRGMLDVTEGSPAAKLEASPAAAKRALPDADVVQKLEAQVQELTAKLQAAELQLGENKDAEVEQMVEALAQRGSEVKALKAAVAERDEQLKAKDAELAEKEKLIAKLQQRVDGAEAQLATHETELARLRRGGGRPNTPSDAGSAATAPPGQASAPTLGRAASMRGFTTQARRMVSLRMMSPKAKPAGNE